MTNQEKKRASKNDLPIKLKHQFWLKIYFQCITFSKPIGIHQLYCSVGKWKVRESARSTDRNKGDAQFAWISCNPLWLALWIEYCLLWHSPTCLLLSATYCHPHATDTTGHMPKWMKGDYDVYDYIKEMLWSLVIWLFCFCTFRYWVWHWLDFVCFLWGFLCNKFVHLWRSIVTIF